MNRQEELIEAVRDAPILYNKKLNGSKNYELKEKLIEAVCDEPNLCNKRGCKNYELKDKLIEAVSCEPVLYNKKLKGYKNHELKEKAWAKVSRKVSISEEKCKRKWKVLRDQFVRECNCKNNPAPIKKPWKYFQSMSFLEQHIAPRQTSSNFNPSENLDIKIFSDVEEFQATRGSLSEIFTPFCNETSVIESVSINSEGPSTPRQEQVRRRNVWTDDTVALQNVYKELLEIVKCDETTAMDLYFKSLSKIVEKEKLSSLQLLDLQSKISKFLMSELPKYSQK